MDSRFETRFQSSWYASKCCLIYINHLIVLPSKSYISIQFYLYFFLKKKIGKLHWKAVRSDGRGETKWGFPKYIRASQLKQTAKVNINSEFLSQGREWILFILASWSPFLKCHKNLSSVHNRKALPYQLCLETASCILSLYECLL